MKEPNVEKPGSTAKIYKRTGLWMLQSMLWARECSGNWFWFSFVYSKAWL